MTTMSPEFGAIRGLYTGWNSLDQKYAVEQQARMDAQRTLGANALSLASERTTIPTSWAQMSPEQRDIITALEAHEIETEEAVALFEDLAAAQSK